MTTVRLFFKGEPAGRQFERSTARNATKVRSAARGAAENVMEVTLRRGRADIAGAGKFGKRWTEGFKGRVTGGTGSGARENIKITYTHSVPYFMVFQTGRVIRGRPMLWIPLSFAKDAQGVRARDFPGTLFRVDRKVGAPLLMSADDKQPKYFGKTSVRIPKKFHVLEIIRAGASLLAAAYKREMRGQA